MHPNINRMKSPFLSSSSSLEDGAQENSNSSRRRRIRRRRDDEVDDDDDCADTTPTTEQHNHNNPNFAIPIPSSTPSLSSSSSSSSPRVRSLRSQLSSQARLSYADLASISPARAVPTEQHAPKMYRAVRQPDNVKVILSPPPVPLSSPSSSSSSSSKYNRNSSSFSASAIPPVYLMRASPNVKQSYALLPGKKPIDLSHHDPNWGCVWFGIVYKRVIPVPAPPQETEYRSPRTEDGAGGAGAAVNSPFYRMNSNPQRNSSNPTFANSINDGAIRSSFDSHDNSSSTNNNPDAPPPLLFQAPSDLLCVEYVAIKQLSLQAVHNYLRKGGQEDPYKEIARMQELGDNIHVLKCIEALRDNEYLYIITPRACAEGTLKDVIWGPSYSSLTRDRIHDWMVQILEILSYLERHGICHRDLSPDNFLFLTPDHLVVFDLALSIRMPHVQVQQQELPGSAGNHDNVAMVQTYRTTILPHGNFGTFAYMAPELFKNAVYDGVGTDLWSCVLILYNLLTRQILYHLPIPSDISFRYFVMARGLSSMPVNERTVEILSDLFAQNVTTSDQKDDDDAVDRQRRRTAQERDQCALLQRATAHINLDSAAMQILEHVLLLDPSQRWSLAQVVESNFINMQQRKKSDQSS